MVTCACEPSSRLFGIHRCRHDAILTRTTLLNSFGSLIQFGCFILLIALIPCALFAGFQFYLAASSWTAGSPGPLIYPAARVIACVLLIYALWRLRQAGLRLRKENSSGH